MKIANLSSLFHQSKKNWWYSHCQNYWGRRNLSFPTVTYAVTPQLDPREENIRIRRQLALAYRIIDRMGLNEGACNHLSAMAPAKNGQGEVMLVTPGLMEDGSALHWSQITASSILGINTRNEIVEPGSLGGQPEDSAACIHLGLRRVVPKAKVIFHTHTDYATALGCLQTSEFPMIHQNGIRFYGRVAFHEEYGLPSDKDKSELLGTYFTGDKTDVLFMCNHGTLLTSPTVHLAFDETYYLERACSNICKSLSAVGGSTDRLKTMPTNLVEDCAKFFTPEKLDLYAKRHFYAYWNLYLKQEPEVFS